MTLLTYEKYKTNGTDWQGDISREWEAKRIKDIGNLVLGKMLNPKKADGYYLKKYLKSKNIGWSKVIINIVDEMYFSETELKTYRVKKGDLLLSEGGEVGKICVWNNEFDECYIQNSVHKFTVNKLNSSLFCFYQLYSIGKSGFYESIVNQVSIKHLTREKLSSIPVVAPPLEVQIVIVEYLNDKASKIDEKIELLRNKKVKYQELKRSLINETVCRGLDKNVKLKDSRVEWIGKIPEAWEVKRVKFFLSTIKGRKLESFDNQTPGSLPNLSLKYLRNDSINFISYSVSSDNGLLVTEKDYVIVWDGAGAGEMLKAKNGYLSSTIAKFKFNKKKVYPLFFYCLRYNVDYFLKRNTSGMGIPHLNPHAFNNYLCPLPPLSEQIKIAKYLDEKIGKIDKITATIDKEINKLAELRKTLINDVVTGKVKIV